MEKECRAAETQLFTDKLNQQRLTDSFLSDAKITFPNSTGDYKHTNAGQKTQNTSAETFKDQIQRICVIVLNKAEMEQFLFMHRLKIDTRLCSVVECMAVKVD